MMTKKEHVINQHYVPRFLLNNFSNKNKLIWTFDKTAINQKWKTIDERAIKKVASQDYFYDRVENCIKGSYEYVLDKVEDKVAPIITEMIKSTNLSKITKDDKDVLALFLALQMIRTKWHLNQLDNSLNDFKKKIESFSDLETEEQIDVKELWFSLMDSAPELSAVLLKKVWCLALSKNDFYISDNPLSRQNSINRSSVRGTLGLDTYGIEIFLPLSSSIVLCLYCEKHLKENGFEGEFLPNIECQSEHVENFNSLQIAYSDRFIFASTDNFELANEILE